MGEYSGRFARKKFREIRTLVDISTPKFVVSGYVADRKVNGSSKSSSGIIYVPRKYIGKKFRMVLIPIDYEGDDELKL